MKKLNPDHLEAVLRIINKSPYFRLLSMKVTALGLGFAMVETDIVEKHLNPFGGVHGGVYSSLIDTAAYWAVYCDVEESDGLISLDVKVDNLAPVSEGHLMIEGKRIKAGKSICIAEAAVIDGAGKWLAPSNVTAPPTCLPECPGIGWPASAIGGAANATMPDRPCARLVKNASGSLPSGETNPMPVMATRLKSSPRCRPLPDAVLRRVSRRKRPGRRRSSSRFARWLARAAP